MDARESNDERPTSAVKRPRPAGIAAAVLLGALGIAALANRVAIEAYLRGTPAVGPDTTSTARQRAWTLRGEALAACDTRRWLACTQKLDEAMQLDPVGESDPRIVGARGELRDATQAPPPP
jgi:hypothetical protein